MKKGKRRGYSPPFVRLEKALLFKQHEYWDLSPRAKNVYLLLKAKYNGANNGKIRLYYSEIQKFQIRGLKNPRDISRAFRELEERKWIERTKYGGLYRYSCEYQLTGIHDKLL